MYVCRHARTHVCTRTHVSVCERVCVSVCDCVSSLTSFNVCITPARVGTFSEVYIHVCIRIVSGVFIIVFSAFISNVSWSSSTTRAGELHHHQKRWRDQLASAGTGPNWTASHTLVQHCIGCASHIACRTRAHLAAASACPGASLSHWQSLHRSHPFRGLGQLSRFRWAP
jgi:hypothetical protein